MIDETYSGSQKAVFVLGMHRSGTSATAGVLHYAGIDFGNRLLPGRADNPKGYFEHEVVWEIHETLLNDLGSGWDDIRPLPSGWLDTDAARYASARLRDIVDREFSGMPLWGLKDPRLSRLFPLWFPILKERSIIPLVVLALRHPLEVAQSLHRRDKIGMSHALGVWLRYTLDAELSSRGFPRVVQYYPRLINDWRTELAKISSVLGLSLPELSATDQIRIDSFIDKNLRHEKPHQHMTEFGISDNLSDWCMSLYDKIKHLDASHGFDDLNAIDDSISDFEKGLIHYHELCGNYIKLKLEYQKNIAWLEENRESLNSEIIRLNDLITDISEKKNYMITRLRREIEYAKSDIKNRDRTIHELYHSTSWKITAPLRIVRNLLS
ncbi:sulfotransferase family protein [Acidiphilium sp. PM]|uniref:sulfotransferase family protein n=1 Tax=Acidiphilium sp. PM TaxID=1043206 RepID=UPI0002145662|nr:sulfotransferase family protein [Acidiphilium sp. PM]EGO97012.1 hypothetical protein APM_0013 [Acidiphilium sp. PM]